MNLFHTNEALWAPLRDEVRAWVRSRYASWVRESPSWFTPAIVKHIPDDLLPEVDVAPESDAVHAEGK